MQHESDCSSVHEAVRRGHAGCLKVLLTADPDSALAVDGNGDWAGLLFTHCDSTQHCHKMLAMLLEVSHSCVNSLVSIVTRSSKCSVLLDRKVAVTHSLAPRLVSTGCAQVSSACTAEQRG